MNERAPIAQPGRSVGVPSRPPSNLTGALPRRLQRMGTVTVGISLPREWVGERGLTPGHSVFVRTLPDGSLILRDRDPEREPVSVSLSVDRAEPVEHLFRRLIAAYLAGATEFAIRQPGGLSPEIRAISRTFARRAGHTESVSEEGATLLLRDVSLGAGPSVPQILRRMFHLVHLLQVDAGTSWTGADFPGPSALAVRDDEIDRCAWQVERGLRMGGSGASLGDALRFLLWARDLERIGDHAVLIGEYGSRLAEAAPPESVRRMLSTYHAQALEHLVASNAVAEHPDSAKANQLLDVGEALHETQSALAERALIRDSSYRWPSPAVRSLGLVLQSIDRTTAYAQNLAEIGLDRDLDRLTHRGGGPTLRPVLAPDNSSTSKRGGQRRT